MDYVLRISFLSVSSLQTSQISLLLQTTKSLETMNVSVNIVELLSCLWQCSAEHGGHICFEEQLENLQLEMQRLKDLSEHLKSNTRPSEELKLWIEEVDKMEVEVTVLVTNANLELQSNCLGNCCPKNCRSRYKMGKKIGRTLEEVKAKINEGKEYRKAEGAFEKALRSLGEPSSVIGLYGRDGIGKTTVLNQISEKLLNSQPQYHFHHVLKVVVSQDPNLEKIQSEIGKEMGFVDRWKEKSFEDRNKDMFEALSHERFLLLLDDIREKIDLTKVGVPTPTNGSKLIFTTRDLDVCNEMGAEENIEVDKLVDKQALELFQSKVGRDILNVDAISQIAQGIAKMCNGLPLALITVARAMAHKKTLLEWEHSAEVLRKSISEISDTKDAVFALLKFSYDSLTSETVKSCLLYCTLFPEDYSINKFDLIDYWIGEGYVSGLNARAEGHKIIRILTDACLLEDEGKDVKMHDLIREVALWIASEYGKQKDKYLVKARAKLSEAPGIARWERARRMSLMANHLQNLADPPRCRDLLTLFLGTNHFKMISSSFFQFMDSLKVLDMSENRELIELPPGISKIERLQYLNLSRTGLRQLPIELRKLVELKCLNLEYTYSLQTIPMQIISCFSKLNVLRMLHCASSDRVVGDGIQTGGHDSMVRELQNLNFMNVLTITIQHDHSLEAFKSLDKFQACIHALSLQQLRHSRSVDVTFLQGMKCLEDLEFSDCMHLKEMSINQSLIAREGQFNSLRKVSVIGCSKLEHLTWLTLAPNLEFLIVSRCPNMEEIIREVVGSNAATFTNVKVLQLAILPELKSICPVSLPFQHLTEIIVDDCPKLKKLPLNSNSAKNNRIVIQGWEKWWETLEWEDEATQTAFISSFKACMY